MLLCFVVYQYICIFEAYRFLPMENWELYNFIPPPMGFFLHMSTVGIEISTEVPSKGDMEREDFPKFTS